MFYRKLVLTTTLLTLLLVALGAYVRLSDAGLGCPDWPGCYGKPTVIHAAADIAAAEAANPQGPVSAAKAWKEMLHRYLAGSVGLCILAIAWLSWRPARRARYSPALASALVAVVVVQALFGKWTVTMLLKPAIVTGHLIGGMLTLGMLAWLTAREWQPVLRGGAALGLASRIGLLLLAGQVVLGGWVSTNYAALICTDLPYCRGEIWPAMDWHNAFHIVRELGKTAAGDMLTNEALTAIHMAHRLGALLVGGYLAGLGLALRAAGNKGLGAALIAAVLVQFSLGLANVAFSLPLPLAVLHNAGAAMLVCVMVVVNFAAGPNARVQQISGVRHESIAA
ncbi:MAG: COX15/CtaA family protein [Rhodocyclaceae bacterium]|nr:COX15/CtaA family protein [Rhodocyclaceae bacterium]MBX3671067.1 COX15/CtaA family protein [Rhodocyclaceae bacterium]